MKSPETVRLSPRYIFLDASPRRLNQGPLPLHQYHPRLVVIGELLVVGHQQEAVRLGLGAFPDAALVG